MEDAHIADISQGDNQQYDIFGVFDGHGGKEVSQFVKQHFTKELLSNNNFKSGKLKQALEETFLRMDELMREPNGRQELKEISKIPKKKNFNIYPLSNIK